MPLRDLEWYAAAERRPPRVLANRGVNGIDGVVSTALGVAAADPATPTLALLGDLAFLHDVSGLVNLPQSPCTFVVVDNGGGGIFSFLPQATSVANETFERLFGTPPTSDVTARAHGFGLAVADVGSIRSSKRRWGPRGQEWCGCACPTEQTTSSFTTPSTRRSVSRSVNVGEGVDVNRRPGGALEGLLHMSVARHRPARLVDATVMFVGRVRHWTGP